MSYYDGSGSTSVTLQQIIIFIIAIEKRYVEVGYCHSSIVLLGEMRA